MGYRARGALPEDPGGNGRNPVDLDLATGGGVDP
jgi:hypothetical protein